MDLSNELISQFVKITNDGSKNKSSESTVYGTAVEYAGEMYVKIDGSDILTPVDTTADIQAGERVTIMIKNHNATVTGNISSPSTNDKVVTKKVEGIEGKVITEVEILIADRVSTKELDAEVARIDTLIAGKATIEELEAIDAKIENLEVENLQAVNAQIENLKAKDAYIENLVADNLKATNADIDILNANFADIKTLVNGNLTSDNILSFHITADKVTMDDAFIDDAMIANVSAGKINSGRINTNLVNIQSEDGSMFINGSTQQFKDDNGNVRIQIGKDATGNFTFVLYGEDGKGQLINQNGITAAAIEDGLIVNDMVSDDAAISGGKLDISSVITEINGDTSTVIKSNKIFLNEQNQSLEVAFNSLKSQVETIQDVTIDGDLSSIVEQVQSNSTSIEINKESINTLVSEDKIIKEQIVDLNGEVVRVENTLTAKYASMEQTLDGFKSEVADTYTTKGEFDNLSIGGRNLLLETSYGIGISGENKENQCKGIYDISDANKVHGNITISFKYSIQDYESGNFRIQTTPNTWINLSDIITPTGDGTFSHSKCINKTVDKFDFTDVQVRMDNFVGFLSIWDMKLEEGTKPTAWTPAPEDIQNDVDAVSENLSANYSTTSAMNSAITQKANEIASSVSSTYATKTSVNDLNDKLTNNYSTTSVMNAAISQKVNEITSSVSNTYATKTELNSANTKITNLTTRVSTAESKLTKDSLTTTIGNHYTTSNDVNGILSSKSYATTSQLTQTSNSLTATFSQSGGYNRVYNGGFLTGDLRYWSGWGSCERYVTDTSIMGFTKKVVIDAKNRDQGIQQTIKGLIPNKKYTFSAIAQVESGQCGIQVNDPIASTWTGSMLPDGTKGPTKLKVTFQPKGSTVTIQLGRGAAGSNGIYYFVGVMLTEGDIDVPWSPHPYEIYEGITTIDANGITVKQSNYNGHTQMGPEGFFVNNGVENVISATASGLSVKGKITATSGDIAAFKISGDSLVGNNVGMCGLSGTNYAFWAGSNTSSSAPFRVGHGGAVVTSDITINGGSINIGGNFKVSTAGALTTNSTIMAQGGIYTYQDIRGMDTSDKTGGMTVVTNAGNLAVRTESTSHSVYLQSASGNVYVTKPSAPSEYIALHTGRLYAHNVIEFSGSNRVVRVHSDDCLYLQCGVSSGNTSSVEVRCTKSANINEYVNVRAYNVCAQNAVFANGVNVSSDVNRKRDIELYEVDALKEICTTPVYTYHLDTDLDEEIKRIGIIMQEAPLDAIDLSGKGVDLYQMTTMLWRAVQQQQDMIDDLRKTIKGEDYNGH